jgi:hypothetical protein
MHYYTTPIVGVTPTDGSPLNFPFACGSGVSANNSADIQFPQIGSTINEIICMVSANDLDRDVILQLVYNNGSASCETLILAGLGAGIYTFTSAIMPMFENEFCYYTLYGNATTGTISISSIRAEINENN